TGDTNTTSTTSALPPSSTGPSPTGVGVSTGGASAQDGTNSTTRSEDSSSETTGDACAAELEVLDAALAGFDGRSRTFQEAGPAVLRVLFLYDENAVAEVEDITLNATMMVSNANEAYINSGMAQRVDLAAVDTIPVFCPEVLTDVNSLTARARPIAAAVEEGDGYAEGAPTMRNRHAADVVALVQGGVSGGGAPFSPIALPLFDDSCALSGFVLSPEADYAAYFVVGPTLEASRALTFAHELGHAQSVNHQLPFAVNWLPASPFGFGQGSTFECDTSGQSVGTVMATSVADRIPYFAAPGLLYAGPSTDCIETGQSVGTGEPSVRTVMDQTAPIVAALRQAEDAFLARATGLPPRAPLAVGMAASERACAEACVADTDHTESCEGFFWSECAGSPINCVLLRSSGPEGIATYRPRIARPTSTGRADCEFIEQTTICAEVGNLPLKVECLRCPLDPGDEVNCPSVPEELEQLELLSQFRCGRK
ncbi:MAG: hypothetical protein AAGA54_34835, partial [Myxococcota bacterium]